MAQSTQNVAIKQIMSFRESGTVNAVKLLPTLINSNNYIGITTEVDSHFKIGDIAYITYRYDEIISNTLDNYFDYFHDENYPFIDYVNGYKIIDVQIENNLIIIDKPYSKTYDNYLIYEHYISKKSVNQYSIAPCLSGDTFGKGIVDSVLFKNVYICSGDTLNVSQAYILGGSLHNVRFKDKYNFKYLSLNNDISGSTYTYNNKDYGYNYCYGTSDNYINLYNCTCDNGWYYYSNISATTINGGYFENCYFTATTINGGYFTNCQLDSTCIWNNGQWNYKLYDPSGLTFGPSYWSGGTWHNGVFKSGKTWHNGIFYNGNFYGLWLNGNFNGTKIVTTSGITYNSNFWGTWMNGIFNGGRFGSDARLNDMINLLTIVSGGVIDWSSYYYYWHDGVANGGDFFLTNWSKGTFNDANFYYGMWNDGTSNNGTFVGLGVFFTTTNDYLVNNFTKWKYGTANNTNIFGYIWENGAFKYGTADQLYFKYGTFYGDFINSKFLNGKFKDGTIKNSIWYSGICEYSIMYDSTWFNGNWYNGVVYNSNFVNVNWSGGTFNSGMMLYLPTSQGGWYGGIFNNGIFGYSELVPPQTMEFKKI